MAWDSSRPVPWQRLMREWVIYALIMVGILLFFVRDNPVGAIAGILISGPLYLGLGAVLAKFGYRRQTLGELRERGKAAAAEKETAEAVETSSSTTRQRPAPTSRTSSGPNRPRTKRRR